MFLTPTLPQSFEKESKLEEGIAIFYPEYSRKISENGRKSLARKLAGIFPG
jgi:hypothetical protein